METVTKDLAYSTQCSGGPLIMSSMTPGSYWQLWQYGGLQDGKSR